MFSSIGGVIKILMFFLNLFKERNVEKAKKKKEIAKEMVDAFSETDPKIRASRVNAAIGSINRM